MQWTNYVNQLVFGGYGQLNPLVEYQRRITDVEEMVADIDYGVTRLFES